MATKDWSKKTSDMPVGVRRQWRADRALRPAMRSPGRPVPSRAVQRQFWGLIATGITTAQAALQVGVSVPVGTRWFRHAGGMRPLALDEPSGRYLSFAEREEIAILWEKQTGVREIARRIGRNPATISRELRRNAATRGGKQVYRAGVAQWKLRKPLSVPNKQNSWIIRACGTMFRSVLLGRSEMKTGSSWRGLIRLRGRAGANLTGQTDGG